MIPADWTPHRRQEDRELLGWIRPEGEGWVAVDLLGRPASGALDWLDAEAVLEERGLRWLAGIWTLEGPDAGARRVRIVEVTPHDADRAGRIVVQTDDYGAIDVPVERFELPWPAPAALRPRRADDPAEPPFSR